MKISIPSILLASAAGVTLAAPAWAQDSRFTWEGSLEFDAEKVYDSDDAANEIHDVYPTITFGARYRFTNVVSAFGALTIEPVLDATEDREFDDVGLYFDELGLTFDFDALSISVGKLHPAFGVAWDAAPGYFGTTFGEDYELSEQIGAMADYDAGAAGVFSLAVFYADDTKLSESWGTNRGRNSSDDGGAGNTGELDNVALQWAKEFGSTTVTIGARMLSAGTGDPEDERGYAAAVSHDFGSGLSLLAEVAQFSNYGGGTDDATYATLGGAYTTGPWTYSAVYSQRDIDNATKDTMSTVGLNYTFANGLDIGGALALFEEDEVQSKSVGLSVAFPLGG
ncbi:porin [Albibacillus kandeliae]|uniref:porin n=1 Tax=Albibacillus kandeliae TaxID=2174228 RepID=UPI000D68F284|nr:porin [Albibacillus kandeliae]